MVGPVQILQMAHHTRLLVAGRGANVAHHEPPGDKGPVAAVLCIAHHRHLKVAKGDTGRTLFWPVAVALFPAVFHQTCCLFVCLFVLEKTRGQDAALGVAQDKWHRTNR